MSATAIHPNSAAAYAETQEARGAHETVIMDIMADFRPRTDREIGCEMATRGHGTEQYRARINSLIKKGLLVEEDTGVVCRITGKTVRLTRRSL